jgi:hypothetical protein
VERGHTWILKKLKSEDIASTREIMNKTRFDLEEDIMSCWQVTEELKVVLDALGHDPVFKDMDAAYSDKLMNLLIGMKAMNELKFNKLFNTFSAVCFPPPGRNE